MSDDIDITVKKSTPLSELEVQDLPDYVVINNKGQSKDKRAVLRTPATKVDFPLSAEDLRDLKILEAKYDHEKNMAGLAAPQIGISKQMIVFAAEDNGVLKKMRPDLTQTMGRTVWLNPSYEGVSSKGLREDFEGCFSVHDQVALVPRYKVINATAQTPNGDMVSLRVEGFLARIIQHEIDHLNSTLCIDKAVEGSIRSTDEYVAWKKEQVNKASK